MTTATIPDNQQADLDTEDLVVRHRRLGQLRAQIEQARSDLASSAASKKRYKGTTATQRIYNILKTNLVGISRDAAFEIGDALVDAGVIGGEE